MFTFWSVALIVCGVLAAASLIVQKQPNARELIEKLTPFQGIIGVIVCIVGLWNVVDMLLNLRLIRYVPGYYTIGMAMGLTMTALGFILGYGLINQYVLSKNPQAAEQGILVQRKLIAIQVPLGIAGIALGIWGLVVSIIH